MRWREDGVERQRAVLVGVHKKAAQAKALYYDRYILRYYRKSGVAFPFTILYQREEWRG